MEFWTSPFLFDGLLCGILHFYSNLNRIFCKANSGDPDQKLHFVASDLGLHCLPMSHKEDTRLIWVKIYFNHYL